MKRNNYRIVLILLVAVFIVLPAVWILSTRLEGEDPSLTLTAASLTLGLSQELPIQVSDFKSGIRKIWVAIQKGGIEMVLLEQRFPSAGFFGGGKIKQESFKVPFEPRRLKIDDGPAVLRMLVWDYSWRGWFKGNKTYVEKNIIVDTIPPGADVLTSNHHIIQGGSGLVIYKVSESCPKKGVYVGENFFPGHSGYFIDKNIIITFFALDFKQGPQTDIYIQLTDQAGNTSRKRFSYDIRKMKFRKDLIRISDRFLNRKMPEFNLDLPENTKAVDAFLKVNQELRKDNFREIVQYGQQTENIMYWRGPFLRFPNSAKKAGFADHREYQYNNRIIDRQVHLGADLASVAQAPVPAANKGRVLLAGQVGIYGNTVIIDHGFGVLSMYAHLSSFSVKTRQVVEKGAIIGHTGSSGLAGGDHLHFSMIVHNVFVNPLEWWHADWIKNSVLEKIERVKSRRE